MRHSFSWGVQNNNLGGRRTEFIKMKGPQGKGEYYVPVLFHVYKKPENNYQLIMSGFAEMAISRQRGIPDTPGTTPLVTPSATPGHSPGHSPEKEELPPFPDNTINQEQTVRALELKECFTLCIKSYYQLLV